MFFIFLTLLSIFFLLWLAAFLYATDFSVPTKSLPKAKNILVIFPHADDEALNAGGLLAQLIAKGAHVTWIVLTQGERGNDGAVYDEKLKEIRTKEAQDAAQIYGVQTFIQRDYADNGVEKDAEKFRTELKKEIAHIHPDLVITYDLAGLYGHPDHVAVSEVVTNILQAEYPDIK